MHLIAQVVWIKHKLGESPWIRGCGQKRASPSIIKGEKGGGYGSRQYVPSQNNPNPPMRIISS